MKLFVFLSLVLPSLAYLGFDWAGLTLTRPLGGQAAEPNQFPYQVGLNTYSYNDYKGFFWSSCGGTLISDQWILTAAECIEDGIYTNVLLGSIYLNGSGGEFVSTETYFLHEEYNKPILTANNICLIKLESPVELSDSIKPASLSASSTEGDNEGSFVIASGWGAGVWSTTGPGGVSSPVLQYINVTVISNDECQKTYGFMVTDLTICLSTDPANTYLCAWDNGGPLVSSDTNNLIGIPELTFFQLPCDAGYPVLVTRLTPHLDWIMSTSGISP